MKKLLILIGAISAYGTDCTISDTVRTPFGGYFAGRIVVALNSPASAQPLYSGSQTLTGWQTTIEVPSTANGVVAFTLVCTDTITPSGTSYSARYQPTSGSGWAETWNPTTGTTTIRAMRATTVPTPTTTFQSSQIVPGSNGQVLTTTAGASAWGNVPACATCVVTSGSYADPAWLTSLAGSKISGAVASATLAASATALATPRTIAGVSFNGTANISIPSTGLSDTADLVRNNAATTYTAGAKQTFAHSATTAGLNVGVQATAPSSPAQGDVFFNTTLTRKGVYDGTQWRYELYAPSSGTGVVSWDGTSLSASTTLAGLASVTSTSFTGALTGNASTATALASTVASGRLWIGQGTGVPTSSANLVWDTANDRLGVGIGSPRFGARVDIAGGFLYMAAGSQIQITGNPGTSGFQIVGNDAATTTIGTMSAYDLGIRTNSSTRVTVNGSSGNLIVGGTYTTDLGYGLHAANKGTNGNFLCFDPTATTGTTKCVARAGQGQSGNIFEIRSYADGVYASFSATGSLSIPQGAIYNSKVGFGYNSTNEIFLTSDSAMKWMVGTSISGTYDASLSRASAGVLQVGDGGANANGYLSAARIGVGTASPADDIEISKAATPTLRLNRTTTSSYGQVLFYESGSFSGAVYSIGSTFATVSRRNALEINSNSGPVSFAPSGTEAGRFAATTGNLLIGTTTDGNYKLDVANSGSSGTLRVYDQTATTGSTKVVVRSGAGQSGNLQEWQNNAGTVLGFVRASDGLLGSTILSTADIQTAALSNSGSGYTAGLNLRSAGGIGWSSTGNWFDTKDLGLARNAAGVIEVNNGTAGTYRDLLARIHTWTSGTEATCSSTTRGQVVMVQGGAGVADTLRVCRKDAADAYAWTALY